MKFGSMEVCELSYCPCSLKYVESMLQVWAGGLVLWEPKYEVWKYGSLANFWRYIFGEKFILAMDSLLEHLVLHWGSADTLRPKLTHDALSDRSWSATRRSLTTSPWQFAYLSSKVC